MRSWLEKELAERYEIERELGQGGMATVWLARDKGSNRPVALKVLRPELASVIGTDRFLREVRTTARLEHPGIVRVLDSGVIRSADGNQIPWYTMTVVDGETLRARLTRETQLPLDDALRITYDVADALQFAHQLGIVHRDIKPENIILANGRAHVLDFGIARAIEETGDDRLTSTGISVGTPAYMSPEQSLAGDIDARTDQYSLAAVLYEMLTGEPPVTGPNAQAVVARRLAEPVRSMRTVRHTIPRAVEEVALKSLERVPADRFPDVRALAVALEHAAASRSPVTARHAARAAVLLLVSGMAVAGALTLRRDRSAVPERDPRLSALNQRGIRGYDRRVPAGALDAVAAFKAAIAIDSTFAAAWVGLAKTYVRMSERRFELPGVPRDSIIRLAVAAVDQALALDSTNSEAWVALAVVSRTIDPTDVRPAVRAARKAIALDSANAPAWHFLAISEAESGQLDLALDHWRECVRRNPGYSQGLAFLGMGHYWRRQYDSATYWADSAVAVDPGYVLGKSTVGHVATERGDFSRAASAFEAAQRVSTDVEIVNALAGRALVEARSGRGESARTTLRQIDSLTAAYVPMPLHTAVYVAHVHAALNDPDRAVAWLARYPTRADVHFQLHLRCDPPFERLKASNRFQKLLTIPAPRGAC